MKTFDYILDNSFLISTDLFFYNFYKHEKGRISFSISSKFGKSNKRNVLKRYIRKIWFEKVREKKILLIFRARHNVKFSEVDLSFLKEEKEKIIEVLDIIYL